MVVTVRFIGPLRSISGKSQITLEHEGAISLREALREIVERHPQIKRALFDSELEDPRPNSLILVNGKDISVLNELETILKNGDEVVLVPVLHGG